MAVGRSTKAGITRLNQNMLRALAKYFTSTIFATTDVAALQIVPHVILCTVTERPARQSFLQATRYTVWKYANEIADGVEIDTAPTSRKYAQSGGRTFGQQREWIEGQRLGFE